MNSFFAQWGTTLMGRPEIFVFQYFRGELWILCLLPIFMNFSGKRAELVVLSVLALGLLPTAQLAFANPLMPATIRPWRWPHKSRLAWWRPSYAPAAAQ